jgi:hypothetical protein
LGDVPAASRIKMGVNGLFFFIVGYARLRKDLEDAIDQHMSFLAH